MPPRTPWLRADDLQGRRFRQPWMLSGHLREAHVGAPAPHRRSDPERRLRGFCVAKAVDGCGAHNAIGAGHGGALRDLDDICFHRARVWLVGRPPRQVVQLNVARRRGPPRYRNFHGAHGCWLCCRRRGHQRLGEGDGRIPFRTEAPQHWRGKKILLVPVGACDLPSHRDILAHSRHRWPRGACGRILQRRRQVRSIELGRHRLHAGRGDLELVLAPRRTRCCPRPRRSGHRAVQRGPLHRLSRLSDAREENQSRDRDVPFLAAFRVCRSLQHGPPYLRQRRALVERAQGIVHHLSRVGGRPLWPRVYAFLERAG
mmetsp:Transcript_90969/g.256966  ORF Transcript_90969/g.256966 Transcript_90969/m.256966 type:complete len:315 (+) Transcript_90969:514-1458(+)